MTETTQAATAIYAITCESDGKCRNVFDGRGGYRRAWQAAYDEGWRCDLSGVRHCPACVAERRPVITLWLDGQALTGYIAEKSALPEDLTPQTVITGVRQSLPAREATIDALPDEPDDRLDEARERAIKAFNAAHDAEDQRESTGVIPVADHLTEIVPAVKADEGDMNT